MYIIQTSSHTDKKNPDKQRERQAKQTDKLQKSKKVSPINHTNNKYVMRFDLCPTIQVERSVYSVDYCLKLELINVDL